MMSSTAQLNASWLVDNMLSYLVLLTIAALATAKKPGGLGGTITAGSPPPCGQSFMSPPSAVSTYIVGGQIAPVDGLPWQVGIYINGHLSCGGSLVMNSMNEMKVITANHCVTRKSKLYSVRFGSNNVTTGGVVLTAHSIVRHSDYNEVTLTSDIAIISFRGGLYFDALAGTNASPICLVSTGYRVGELARISGWGTTSESGTVSHQLRYVDNPILDYNYCNTQTGIAGEMDSTMLCSADKDKDSCQGDSGGPLAVYRNNEFQLAGIVSWGYGCARDNFPGVYSDVNNLRSWIDDNL